LSTLNAVKHWQKSHPKIKNVVLFVSDALRWDYLPEDVRSMGVTFKTVASGTFTAPSFASIISGEYQPRHGVDSLYNGRLSSDGGTLLNLDGYNSSLWTQNIWTDFEPRTSAPIYTVLDLKNRVSLKDIKTPFIYLEDEKGGHCPYGLTSEDKECKQANCQRFFRDLGGKGVKELRERYKLSVKQSIDEFRNRLKIIEDRGLWDETLVIFLADHGELLGEHGGLVGHETFSAPEIVYVPVVLIHPDLPKGVTCENEGVLRHVDLYPTICNVIGRRIPAVDGLSLFDMEKLPDWGLSYYVEKSKRARAGKYTLETIGLWDKDGGHVFRIGMNNFQRFLRSLYLTTFSDSLTATYQRQRIQHFPLRIVDNLRASSYCYKFHIKFGCPSLKKEEARLIVEKTRMNDNKFREKRRIVETIRQMQGDTGIYRFGGATRGRENPS